LGESLTMITDSRNRLETALNDIKDHMVREMQMSFRTRINIKQG